MNFVGALFSLVPAGVAWQLLRQVRLSRRAQLAGTSVPGIVVRQREVKVKGGTRWVPTVRYTTLTGHELEGEGVAAIFSPELNFFDGDEVSIYYDPRQPRRFLFAQELAGPGTYALLAGAAGMALLFLGTALVGR